MERAPRDSATRGIVPRHFYGELVKTETGRIVLENSSHFAQFSDFIRENGMEDEDEELIAKVKGVVWAIVRSP